MPQRITWDEASPKIERHGFTDYLETNKGWKPVRVFDGRGQGRFRLTRVGRRFYEKNTLNEYVIQLPALFRTYKEAGAPPVEHMGVLSHPRAAASHPAAFGFSFRGADGSW